MSKCGVCDPVIIDTNDADKFVKYPSDTTLAPRLICYTGLKYLQQVSRKNAR